MKCGRITGREIAFKIELLMFHSAEDLPSVEQFFGRIMNHRNVMFCKNFSPTPQRIAQLKN